MRARDPEVYVTLGYALRRLGGDRREAAAWLLVACDVGYDCRLSNPRFGLGCVEHGHCRGDETIQSAGRHG